MTQQFEAGEAFPDDGRGMVLLGKDGDGVLRVVQVAADGTVATSAGGSSGGGTEYTEGDTDSSITGTALLWEDTGDTLRPVSAAKPLPVDIKNATIAIAEPVTVDGTVTVSDGGDSLTVDGTVTANPTAATGHSAVSAASTNATSVKGSAGTLFSIEAFNTNAAPAYLKLYNKATAPTVGTDTPVRRYCIPGNVAGAGVVFAFPKGVTFDTGIAYAITTGAADSNTDAVAANEVLVNLSYT